jgi:hypothetical protein
MASRKFVVAPCVFDSKYSWFMYVFAILEFSAEYDYVTHKLISGGETDVSICLPSCNDVRVWWLLFPPSARRWAHSLIGRRVDENVMATPLTFNAIESVASQFL